MLNPAVVNVRTDEATDVSLTVEPPATPLIVKSSISELSVISSVNVRVIVVEDAVTADTTVGEALSTAAPIPTSSATFASSVVAKFEPASSLYVNVGVELVSPLSAVVKVIIQVPAFVITTSVTVILGTDKTQSAGNRPAGIAQFVSVESTTIVVAEVLVTVESAASNAYAS
jgi:hypothetical protein